ncbi:hypothetical protein C5O80_36585 [Burkholderia sp. SRS-46]|nr:hypothetical protein C5O80_36585 [Burkholderia sp. SRS-46]
MAPRHALLSVLASFLERWASHDIAWFCEPAEQARAGMADAGRAVSIERPASDHHTLLPVTAEPSRHLDSARQASAPIEPDQAARRT